MYNENKDGHESPYTEHWCDFCEEPHDCNYCDANKIPRYSEYDLVYRKLNPIKW